MDGIRLKGSELEFTIAPALYSLVGQILSGSIAHDIFCLPHLVVIQGK